MNKIPLLLERLKDRRGKRVIFLSHCVLNENTRYLGGACRSCCVREVMTACLERDISIVQMPCPEQEAWGGVLKRLMLQGYGMKGTPLYRVRALWFPVFAQYTRRIYRRLARHIANQIHDYLQSGFSIIGVVGIDGSPSCGVHQTVDLAPTLERIAQVDITALTVAAMNAIIRQEIRKGSGLFITELHQELARRHIRVPFLAHNLMEEIDGLPSSLQLPTPHATGC